MKIEKSFPKYFIAEESECEYEYISWQNQLAQSTFSEIGERRAAKWAFWHCEKPSIRFKMPRTLGLDI